MTFYNKYLKYKNKYIGLKNKLFVNQSGGEILNCSDIIYLNNRLGTCWNTSIQMGFLFSDNTAIQVQTALSHPFDAVLGRSYVETPILLKLLPFDFFIENDYNQRLKPEIIMKISNIFREYTHQLSIKKEDYKSFEDTKEEVGAYVTDDADIVELSKRDGTHELRRSQSQSCEQNFSDNFLSLFYDMPHVLLNNGLDIDVFFLSLLFGILLLKKAINIGIYKLYNTTLLNNIFRNDIESCDINTYPILINYTDINSTIGHACSFYKCNGKFVYYDNTNETPLCNFKFDLFWEKIIEIKGLGRANILYMIFQHIASKEKIPELGIINDTPFIIFKYKDEPYFHANYWTDAEHDIIISEDVFKNININKNYYRFHNFIILSDVVSPVGDIDAPFCAKYIKDFNIYYLDYYIFNKKLKFDSIERHIPKEDILQKLYFDLLYNSKFRHALIEGPSNTDYPQAIDIIDKKYIDINSIITPERETILLYAIKQKLNPLIDILLRYNVNINQKSGPHNELHNELPLLAAINTNNTEIALKLLDIEGILINEKSGPYNEIPLLAAINKNNTEIALKLLDMRGILIDKRSGSHDELPLPLELAYRMKNDIVITKILAMPK